MMEKFVGFTSQLVPLDRANVDTDAIIPKQFLKSIHRTGFGPYLFDEWRYLDRGEPGMDCSNRPLNPEFVLNQPRYANARILLSRQNFGCGSSREHAPWALKDFGFDVIIAPSFADIFYNNCFKNGLLPIVLEPATVEELFVLEKTRSPLMMAVDLKEQVLIIDSTRQIRFDLDKERKHRLLQGLDDIGMTLQQGEKISQFEQRYRQRFPWYFLADNHTSETSQ